MPKTNFLTESLATWRDDRQGLIDEVENIRATKFDFRPTPEVRSVREMIQHILEVAMMMTGELTQPKPDFSRATYPEFLEMYSQAAHDAQIRVPPRQHRRMGTEGPRLNCAQDLEARHLESTDRGPE